MGCPYFKGKTGEFGEQMATVICDGKSQNVQQHKGFPLRCDWLNYEGCDIYKQKKKYCPHFNGVETYSDIRNKNVIKCSKGHIKCFHGEATTNIINICTGNYSECEKYKEEHKMSELTTVTQGEITEGYQKAVRLHAEIMANAEIAATSLTEMCKGLKTMRDEKLYKELGYETFEQYSEEKAGIKSRQAYTYIATYEKLGKDFLQSNANFGITKLEMIAQLPFYERDEFMDENDIEGMSTRELKEALEKITKQGEQIGFLTEENEKLKAQNDDTQLPAETLAEISELKKQIDSLKSVNEDRENDLDKLAEERMRLGEERDKALEERNKADGKAIKLEKEIKELQSKPVDVAIAEPSPEQLEKIRAEAKAEAEAENKKSLAEKAKEIERLREIADKAGVLEEKLKAANNDKVKEFKIYFADAQDRLSKLFEIYQSIEEPDIRIKLGAAFSSFLDTLKANIEGE